jgi:mRNA interferase MazF
VVAHNSFVVCDIVRVEFPYADQPLARKRPALVIATPDLDAPFAVLWVVMITSARHDPWRGDVAITDLDSAGLSRASYIRTSKVATIDTRYVSPIGCLAEQDRGEVVHWLRTLFATVLSHA